MVWLVIGLAGQVAAAFHPTLGRPLSIASFHVLTVGWLTQVVIGVAIWLFPTRKGAFPRGSDRLGWAVLCMLNAGVLLRTAAEPMFAAGSVSPLWLLAATVLQFLAAVGFVLLMRGRIRGP